jgi:hypothetical protein
MLAPLLPILDGPALCRLMRVHQCPMRTLSARLGIPQTRIRLRRAQGISDPHVARDWMQAVTGNDPGPL